MSRALIVTEPELNAAALVALASSTCDAIDALVLVDDDSIAFEQPGTERTFAISGSALALAEVAASEIARLVEEHDVVVVVLPSLHRYREIAALLTARLNAACGTDIIAAKRTSDGLVVERLLYGGVVVASVLLQRPHAVLTARIAVGEAACGLPVTAIPVTGSEHTSKTLVSRTAIQASAGLATAQRVVSFGRGVRAQDDMAMIQHLAGAVGASLGCSRPIVDDVKWLPLTHQIGLTGNTVQPDLYIAIGISGQVQHLVGMRDSRFIVSINNNPTAPIFDASDLAVVGDLYSIVPKLAAAIVAR